MASYRQVSQFAFRNRMLVRFCITAGAAALAYLVIWRTHA
jgi:hypothetical protein